MNLKAASIGRTVRTNCLLKWKKLWWGRESQHWPDVAINCAETSDTNYVYHSQRSFPSTVEKEQIQASYSAFGEPYNTAMMILSGLWKRNVTEQTRAVSKHYRFFYGPIELNYNTNILATVVTPKWKRTPNVQSYVTLYFESTFSRGVELIDLRDIRFHLKRVRGVCNATTDR